MSARSPRLIKFSRAPGVFPRRTDCCAPVQHLHAHFLARLLPHAVGSRRGSSSAFVTGPCRPEPSIGGPRVFPWRSRVLRPPLPYTPALFQYPTFAGSTCLPEHSSCTSPRRRGAVFALRDRHLRGMTGGVGEAGCEHHGRCFSHIAIALSFFSFFKFHSIPPYKTLRPRITTERTARCGCWWLFLAKARCGSGDR